MSWYMVSEVVTNAMTHGSPEPGGGIGLGLLRLLLEQRRRGKARMTGPERSTQR
jgi:hypothetical protein